MHFNKTKRAEIVRFAFLIYMLVLGVAFGLFLFKGYTLVVESESLELKKQLQFASFIAQNAFTLNDVPINLHASIDLPQDVTSIRLFNSSIAAYVRTTPIFNSFMTYENSLVEEKKVNSSTVVFTAFNNTLYFGEKERDCLRFSPPMIVIQDSVYDRRFLTTSNSVGLTFDVKSRSDVLSDEIQIVFDLDNKTSEGLLIYSNQQENQLCTLTSSLDNNNVDYAVLPITDYEYMLYPQLKEKMTYIVGPYENSNLIGGLKEFKS